MPPRPLDMTLSDSLVAVRYTAREVWMLPFGEKRKLTVVVESSVGGRGGVQIRRVCDAVGLD